MSRLYSLTTFNTYEIRSFTKSGGRSGPLLPSPPRPARCGGALVVVASLCKRSARPVHVRGSCRAAAMGVRRAQGGTAREEVAAKAALAVTDAGAGGTSSSTRLAPLAVVVTWRAVARRGNAGSQRPRGQADGSTSALVVSSTHKAKGLCVCVCFLFFVFFFLTS